MSAAANLDVNVDMETKCWKCTEPRDFDVTINETYLRRFGGDVGGGVWTRGMGLEGSHRRRVKSKSLALTDGR